MKANEVPEKLYIDFRDRAESTWRCAYTEKAMANDIEYIRTDAFIEKACEYLDLHCNEVKTDDNSIAGWIDNEFIDNFRKAMKS